LSKLIRFPKNKDLLLEMTRSPVAIIFILVGALNWLGVGIIGVNVLERFVGKFIARILYVLVGIAALSVAFNRDTYLPFLGETVMPCSILSEHIPKGADTSIAVNVTPGATVLYWAAEPETEGLKNIVDWRKAYLKFMNAGVVKADGNGDAILLVKAPQPYTVPWKGRLEPHIHFRVCGGDGIIGRIKTVYVSDGRVEGFTN
jgi:uncharacterized membrane protein YuzA (DUF378 family)